MSDPVLYIKRGCPYCAGAIRYLDQRGVIYDEVDVTEDRKAMQELKDVSGQESTPTLVFDGHVLADFDVHELEEFLGKGSRESNE